MNITDNSFDKYEKSELQKKIEEEFAMLAHDLKSPIFSQQNALQLLLKEKFGKLSNEQKEVVELLYSSNNYSVNLVNNILLSYKFGNGGIILNPEIFDLCMVVRGGVEVLQYTLKEKGNHISLELPENCNICADKIAIRRVVMNILSNAIKYSKNDSKITVSVQKDNGVSLFTVMNIGEYMQEDEIKNLFQKDRVKNTKKSMDSNGLGLFITSELIKMHGGHIIAKSIENGKNIFGFELKNEIQFC